MAAEEVITVYKSEVEGHIKGLNEIIEAIRQAVKAKKEGEATDKQAAVTATQAAQKRKEAIEQEQTTLLKLQEAKKKAFTVTEIDGYNKKIAESEKNIKTLKGTTEQTQNLLREGFNRLGTAIVAAFAIGQVISFGKECARAFQEAEKNALKLKSAVSVNGGLASDFERLLKQSVSLQKTTIFSDDAIQNAQTAALQFGLTADEVERLIPIITDFASATGQDLNSALDSVLQGINGAGRGLKIYGVAIEENSSRQERLTSITDQLTKKFEGQAEVIGNTAAGATEKYKNQLDDLKESIGERLQPILLSTLDIFNDFIGGINLLISAGANLFDSDKSIFNPQNWIDAANSTDDFDKKFKAAFETAKAAAKDTSTQKIILEITGLMKEQATAVGDSRTNILGTIAGLRSLLKEREEAAKSTDQLSGSLDRLKNITILSDSSLKDLKKTLSTFNDTKALDAIDKINDELKRRAKDSDKEAAQRDKDREEAFKRQQDINKKSADDSLSKQLSDLEIAKQKELQVEEHSIQEKLVIDLKYLELRRKLFEDDAPEQAKITAEQEKIKTQIIEQALKDRSETDAAVEKQNEESAQRQIETEQEKQDRITEIRQAAFDLEKELSDFVLQLAVQNSNERIAILEDEKDVKLAAIDDEIAALEEQRNKRIIGEADFENKSAALKQKRVDEEKKINLRINEEKRKQAKISKDIAIFEATLNFSKALIAALTIAPPASFIAEALTAAIAGVQLAAVISQPIPKFEYGGLIKGKRHSMGGTLIEAEDGEFVNKRVSVHKYRKELEAANELRLEEFINDNYILPALINQRRKFEEEKEKSFANNLAASIILNSKSGLDEYGMARALNKVNPRLAREIGKEVARNLPGNSYSAYMD